jgi:hypothetical protein
MTKPRTIYHEDCEWVKKSAYIALEKENQRLRSALESIVELWGSGVTQQKIYEMARLALKGE